MKGLKELVGKLKLLSDIDIAIADHLQNYGDRIASLETLCKRQQDLIDGHSATIFKLQEVLGSYRSQNK